VGLDYFFNHLSRKCLEKEKGVNSAGFSIRIDMSREDEYGRNDSLR
jgi:hypothetical protein